MKRTRFLTYLVLALAALFVFFSLRPRPAHSAVTADAQVQTAWQSAKEVGAYAYRTDIVQTAWPLPLLENVGLSSREQRLHIEGQTDLAAREMEMKLWSGGGNVMTGQDSLQVRTAGGQTFGRVGDGAWQEVAANDGAASLPNLLAPGNDALGYLAGVKNVQNLGAESRMGVAFTRYSFQVDGPAFAEHMRAQLEDEMRRNGRLPLGLRLDVSRLYAQMTGSGEIWLDQAGLPLRQIVNLKFPPGQYEQVEVRITTDFSQWGEAEMAAGERGSGGVGTWTAVFPSKIQNLKSKIDVEAAAANAGLLLGLSGLMALAVVHRNSKKVYAAMAVMLIISMLFTPLLQTYQAKAFFAEQKAQQVESKNAPENNQTALEWAQPDFDPHEAPLARGRVGALANGQGEQRDTTDSDGDGLTDAVENQIGINPNNPDTDGDGLDDGAEVLELGIDPKTIDTDGDLISDLVEVNGYRDGNGRQWYLNPAEADTNGDGQPDTLECFALKDVAYDENGQLILTTSAGDRCADTDGDGDPDAFDLDDDDDGVPDTVDMARTTAMGGGRNGADVAGFSGQTFQFQVDNLTADMPATVDFQFRPADPDHLWYSLSILDWPGGDREGQIQRVHDTTFADAYNTATDPPNANGDMRLIPLLEIEIPFQTNGYGGLPALPNAPAQITTTTPITAWLDTSAAARYQIIVRKKDEQGNLLAYVPVSLVREQENNSPVAFAARMYYRPTAAGFGLTQQARLVWLVQGITDSCTPPNDATPRDAWCAIENNWTTNPPTILHTYYDDWYLTGLTVKEDHGLEAGVIYEDPNFSGRNPNYEENLWWLAYGLDQTFIAGRRDLTIPEIERRFDITSTATITDRWHIPAGALGVETFFFPEQSYIAQLPMTHTQQILNANFTAAISPTLLFVREEHFRSAALEMEGEMIQAAAKSAGVIGDNQLTVDLNPAWAREETLTGMNWAPYRYNAALQEWESYRVEDYWDYAEARYREIFGRDPESDPDGSIQTGQVILAHLFYLSYYQGVSNVVQVGDAPLVYDWQVQLADEGVALARSGETAVKTIVSNVVEAALTKEYKTYAAIVWDASGNITRSRFEAEVGGGFAGVRQTFSEFKSMSRGRKAGVALGVTAVVAGAGLLIGLGVVLDKDAGEMFLLISHTINLLLAVYDVVDTAVAAVRAVQSGLNSALKAAESALEGAGAIASIVGLIIIAVVEIGIFVYQIIASGVKFLSLAFDEAAAAVAANIIVAAILVAIFFIPVFGPLIVAIISLIDAVINLVCLLTGANELESEDPWSWQSIVRDYVCAGITGNLAKLVQWLIYDQTPVVDLEEEDRLQIGNFGIALENPADGFTQGNQLQLSAVVTSTLYRSWPTSLLPYPAYIWQYGPRYQKKSNFAYQFATTENDLHDNMDTDVIREYPGDADGWREDAEGHFYIERTPVSSYIFPLNQTGVNQSVTAYLAEGHAIKTQECFFVPAPWFPLFPPGVPVCYLRNEKDTLQIDLSDSLKFDVLPATLTGFHQLTPSCSGSCALAWGEFPALMDADGDGLRSSASGGNDPNDSAPDSDFDGLSDFYEIAHGSDPTAADGDNDGLTDYDELRYQTDPFRADSDNDGLLDGEETAGWEYVYGFDNANQPLTAWVTADPLQPDTDGDGLTDKLEQVYGFNPRVPGPANVLAIRSVIDDEDGIVKPGDTVVYTATIKNELRDRYALGLFAVNFPQNVLTGNLAPQVYQLNPRDEASLSGSVTVAGLSQSQEISLTNTAGAIIANLRADADGRQLWLHLDEESGATTFMDDSLRGNDAVCQGNGCPAAGVDGYYGRSLQFDGNDRVSVSLDLSENAYSLALWFQTACADCGIASVNLTTGRNLFLKNGKICAEVGSEMCTSTAGYDDGRWHHVVHTIRSTDGVQKLYADGVLAAAGSFNLPPATQETIYLGAAANRAGFVGLMDEVEVYSAVLSEEEITERFQQPIFYAKFDEPSGPFKDTIYGLPLNCSGNRCPDRVGGVRGGAVSFNQGQHLQTSGPQLDLSRGNGRFTLSAWMYPLPDDGKWHALFGDVPGNADKNQSPSLWVKGSELWARFGNGDDATQVCGFRGFVLRPNEWQHVAAAFDGNLLDVYVNGQLVGSGTDCAGLTPYPTTNLHIGRASQRGWIKFTYVDVTDEGDGWGTAEYYLSLDDVPVWAQDEIDVGAYVINETRILDDDAAHRFKLWELDDWPNGANDLNIDQTFSNATIGIFATDYDADGEGTLHWQSWNQFYEGRLDDLRLYSYALTAADVADLYQSSYRALEMRFDEPPGADTFRDYSGNGVVGVCTPPHCPDTGLAGRSNQAARFDGLDDYVDASALTGGLAGQAISFGGWVYPDTAQSSQSGLLTFENAAGNYVLNQLLYHPTQNKFSYSDGKTPPVFSQNSFAPGQWYQVMAVIDENDNGTLFVNGAAEAAFTTQLRPDGDGRFRIGYGFKGMIDQAMAFNAALSAAEIADLMAESPVLNLHLDEPLGTAVFANAANPALNGTCNSTGCPAAGADGWMRQSLVFDGVNDRITIAHDDALDLQKFSVGMWVKPAGPKPVTQTLILKDNSFYRNFGLVIMPNSMQVQASIRGIQAANLNSVGSLLQNQWNHVMMTFDCSQFGSPCKLNLYLNGALDSQTQANIILDARFGDTFIGSDQFRQNAFAGQIDELAVYGRELSQRDVKELYDYQVSWFDAGVAHRLTVDAEKPTVHLAFSPTHIAAAAGQVIAVQAQDETSGLTVEVQIDGGGWRPAASAEPLALAGTWVFTASLTAPGTHTIEARAADRVGHLSDVDSVTFVVDAAAPLVAVDAAVTQQVLPAYQNGGAWTVDLSGSVIDPAPASGVTAVIIELLDEAGNAVGGRLPAQLANERWQIAYPFFTRPGGRYTIRVTAVDQVGHETVWANETIGADGTPPVIDISYTEPFSRANAAEPLPQVMAGVNPTPVIRGTVSDIATPGNRLFSFHFEVAAGAATFYDSSGLWQNAVCGQTACPTAASGRWGQGLRFDGSDDTLTIPEYTFVPTNYTMAAWFKTDTAVPQTILAAANPANDNPGALLQLGGDGRLHYIHRLPTGTSGGQDLVSPAAYDDGRWHHLAAVRNGVDLGLFVDGRIVVTGTTNLTATQGLSLTIGSLGNGGHFDGWLDEVMVYGRALSSEQIQAMANPAAAGVAGLEIRLRHLQDGDGTSLPWLPITLAQPGAAFSAWSYPLPAGLEGPYQLDLRATDSFGHVNTQLDAWVGEIDTLAPRVELRVGDTYHRGNTNLTSYQCLVTDYNLTDRGFSCPVDVTAVNQNAAWYTAWFSQTKVYQYASPYWTWLRDENGPYTLTACDLFDNCSTAVPTAPRLTTVAQSPLTIAIWTPAPQSVFTPTEPITLTGYAYALNNLSALTVTVNGVPISTTTWTSSITETVWSVVWTPPAEGVYTLAAAISDQTGGVSSSQIPAVVDVTPPELNVSTRNVNGRNYDDAGYVTISGQISDTVGVDRLQINLNGMGWQEAAVPTSALPITFYDFDAPVYAGSALPPVGETFTITARVTDLAGQTAVVTHTVWADVVPPAPITMTLSYDNAGSPQLITPGMTIRDVLTPTLLITWPAASDDGSGIAGYRAGWTVTPTLSVAQIINLPAYAAAGQHAQVVGEAQPVYAHLVIEDNTGNETAQTMGPVYVDAPLTPDYVGQADSLSYRGWMESGCSLVGVDRRLAERAPLTPEQRFYLTWDDANLRLAWTGADWDVDGDLFVYLDTEAGGSSQAYDPYTSTMTNTAVYLPGVTPISVQPDAMQADYLVWVQDADTAVLLHWNGGSWITQTLLTSAQFQFDRRLADPLFPERPAGQTDLILPFSLLGLSAGSPVDALAFATEEGALRLWATMPGANPLNSGRVAGTAVYAADQHIFALNQRYHWDNLDSGVCANGAYPDGDLQMSLTVEPSGAVYRFLADDLFWQWATLLGNRPADASLGVPLVDGDPPPLADGQAISYTLTYRNQGRETAVGARVVLSATYALRLPGGDLPGQTTQTVWLGDVAAGATGSVVFQGEIVVPASCAATTGDACQWAGLTAEIYDDAHPESGPPLEWMWADHRVDSRPPEFFGVLRPEFLLAAGENVLYGYAYDEAGVSAVTLEVQSPLAGTSLLTCPDGTPGDGRWSCLLDAAGANDGDVFSLRLGASDAFGQASDLANERPVTFVVDASPPTVTVTTPTGLLNDTAFVLNGRIADNWGLGGVAVCLNGECETADLQLETAVLPVAVTDAPGTPLALGSATGCGGGEIARTLMVTESFAIGEISVGLNITHTFRDDLQVELLSPAGTRVRLVEGSGSVFSAGQNYDLLLFDAAENRLASRFDDDPGLPLFDRWARPLQPMRPFIGEDSQGSWTLTICDNDPTQHDGAYNQSRLLISPQDTAVRAGNWFYRGTAVAGDYVEQTLSIYGTDLVGNQTQPLTFTFAVDTAAPVITVTTQPTAAVAMGDPFRLAGLVSDGGQVQVMRLSIIAPDGSVLADTIDHTNGMWVYTDTSKFVQGGAYTLFVEAEDEAGNQSVAGPFVLTIVALEPTRIYLPLILQY